MCGGEASLVAELLGLDQLQFVVGVDLLDGFMNEISKLGGVIWDRAPEEGIIPGTWMPLGMDDSGHFRLALPETVCAC